MSAIALLDVSGADAAFVELVAMSQAAAALWAAQHPGAVNNSAGALAPQVSRHSHLPCFTHTPHQYLAS